MSSIYHTDHVAPAGGVVFAVDFAQRLANRQRLVALYEAWGRPAKAALYRSPP